MPCLRTQRAVLEVFEGATNKEIAVKLGTSESSVKAVMQQPLRPESGRAANWFALH